MRLLNLCVLMVLMVMCLFFDFAHPDPPFSIDGKGGRGRDCVSRLCRSRWDRMQMPAEEERIVEEDGPGGYYPHYPEQPAPGDGGGSIRNYLQNDIVVQPIIIMPGATLPPDIKENLLADQ